MPMNNEGFELKKRLKHREDMFLRRLFAMLAKMAKADRKVDAWEAHAAERAFERFPRAASRRKFCVMAAKKYHPDLLRANGYSESLIQKATIKMAQINAAWEKIRKERDI